MQNGSPHGFGRWLYGGGMIGRFRNGEFTGPNVVSFGFDVS